LGIGRGYSANHRETGKREEERRGDITLPVALIAFLLQVPVALKLHKTLQQPYNKLPLVLLKLAW
jgi:hypothetical protein